MKDTAPDIAQTYRKLLMARSNEQRFQMGLSMCQTARTIVWSSLPDDLDPAERRAQFFLRYYGRDLDPALRDEFAARIRREAPREQPPHKTIVKGSHL